MIATSWRAWAAELLCLQVAFDEVGREPLQPVALARELELHRLLDPQRVTDQLLALRLALVACR